MYNPPAPYYDLYNARETMRVAVDIMQRSEMHYVARPSRTSITMSHVLYTMSGCNPMYAHKSALVYRHNVRAVCNPNLTLTDIYVVILHLHRTTMRIMLYNTGEAMRVTVDILNPKDTLKISLTHIPNCRYP
jgi:hypothetical protein